MAPTALSTASAISRKPASVSETVALPLSARSLTVSAIAWERAPFSSTDLTVAEISVIAAIDFSMKSASWEMFCETWSIDTRNNFV